MQELTTINIECARGEIRNALSTIRGRYNLPPCIMDGILSSMIAEIRAEGNMELVDAASQILKEKDLELSEAKKAAKKVLQGQGPRVEVEEDGDTK
ncbi:MAG: hypothetical protein IJ567_05590 [Lachnospiraceae bacterium]|nr:hypothetical protein [Lachnospiraceae bacterium]